MEIILLSIYALIVWLIYFKLKLLPWTLPHQVTVVVLPVVGLTILILSLNYFAPTSHDARVINYVVQIVPQARGHVIAVPAQGNRHMKKGEVLFQIDPKPYQLDVQRLEAQLASAEASASNLKAQLSAAVAKTASARAQLALAQKRVAQNKELVASGAGNRFDLEQAETSAKQLQADVTAAVAGEAQVREQLGAVVDGEPAQVAQVKAELEKARWQLDQTTVRAPSDGTPINVQLQPGSMVVGLPLTPAMSFVEDEQRVVAYFHQNELTQVAPGDEAELALPTYPGRVIKARVESVVWAQGMGQLPVSGTLPQTGTGETPPGRFAVKLRLDDKEKGLFLAAGAAGEVAIYTARMEEIQILRRVLIRVHSDLNYLILKLH